MPSWSALTAVDHIGWKRYIKNELILLRGSLFWGVFIMRKRLLYLFDLLVVALSPFVAVVLRNNFSPSSQQLLDIIPFAVLGLCVAAVVFLIAGTHRGIWRYVSLSDFSRIIVATAITLLITLFVTFSLKPFFLSRARWRHCWL